MRHGAPAALRDCYTGCQK